MKRNTWLIAIIAVGAVFLVFNPLQTCQNRNATVRLPYVNQKDLVGLVQFAEGSWQSPVEYLAGLFASRDVVFVGEFYKIKQHASFIASALPALYAKGVRTLGIEYALAESQPGIDALLAAPAWDETKARRILFDWVVTWGYQEYVDVLKAAWQLNRGLAAGAPAFRILGLNVRQNWELVKTDRDVQDTETVKKILANGIPDEYMAKILLREVVDKGGKALVYCSLQHAFTRYRSKDYEKNMKDKGFAEVRRAGNIVSDAIGAKAATVALHAPWPDPAQRGGLAYPVEGTVDTLLSLLPAGKQSGGWDTAGTQLGSLAIRSGSYLSGYQSLKLADLCDGYVTFGPLTSCGAVTPIQGFVPADAGDYAVKNFPGPKPAGLDAKMVQQAIIDEAAALEKALRQFQ